METLNKQFNEVYKLYQTKKMNLTFCRGKLMELSHKSGFFYQLNKQNILRFMILQHELSILPEDVLLKLMKQSISEGND